MKKYSRGKKDKDPYDMSTMEMGGHFDRAKPFF